MRLSITRVLGRGLVSIFCFQGAGFQVCGMGVPFASSPAVLWLLRESGLLATSKLYLEP